MSLLNPRKNKYTYQEFMSMSKEDIGKFYHGVIKDCLTTLSRQDIHSINEEEYIRKIKTDIWEYTFNHLEGGHANTICAEEVIYLLMKQGVDPDNIFYNERAFNILLKDIEFRLGRGRFNTTAEILYPNVPAQRSILPNASDKTIADFLLWFDSIMTNLNDIANDLLVRIEEVQRSKKKEKKVSSIMETALNIISEETLAPLGIKYSFAAIHDSDTDSTRIHSTFQLRRGCSFLLSVDEALELFKHPEAIISQMTEDEFSDKFYTVSYSDWTYNTKDDFEHIASLRYAARVNLARYGIYIGISCKEGKLLVEAVQKPFISTDHDSMEAATAFISNPQKVMEKLMENVDIYNFVNFDKVDLEDMPF